MNELMLKYGFSDTDYKYVQIFKKRPIIIKNHSNSDKNQLISLNISKNSLDSFEKPTITTAKKLNQIIQDLELKKKGIRKRFLINNKSQSENIFSSKLQELIKKKNNIIEQKQKINNKVEKLDGVNECIQRLIKFKKKYALDENLVKLKIKENNKTPPLCRYSPNFDSIRKHVPSPDFSFHQTVNPIKIKIEEENKKQIEKKNNFYDNEYEPIEEYDDINAYNRRFRNYSSQKMLINPYNYNDKISNINLNRYYKNNNQIYPYLIKSIGKKKNYDENYEILGAPRYESSSNELAPLNPEKLKKNISVPNFNKMISRDTIFYLNHQNYLPDYSPNYDSIYSNANKYKYIDEELKYKKNKLRKIITSSNPPGEYLLLPILNK